MDSSFSSVLYGNADIYPIYDDLLAGAVGLVWLNEVEMQDIRGTEGGILFSKIPDLWKKLSSCWLLQL